MCPYLPPEFKEHCLVHTFFFITAHNSLPDQTFPIIQSYFIPLPYLLAYSSYLRDCSFQPLPYCCATPTSFDFFWSICIEHLSSFFTWSTLPLSLRTAPSVFPWFGRPSHGTQSEPLFEYSLPN